MNRIITLSMFFVFCFCDSKMMYAVDDATKQQLLSPAFPVIVPPTPEVNKLLGMLQFPVGYNTGTVTTEIPIYEIKLSSGFTLPIKLEYQSSGFKPRERSTVGVGWTLIAEPRIAHSVNGLPDESNDGLYMNEGLELPANYPARRGVAMAYGRYDISPDQYSYILPGKSGSFFLNRDMQNRVKEFVTVPYTPIRIKNNSNLTKFSLTDIDGVRYSFIPIERTTTTLPEQLIQAITVYKADSIITPNHEVIRFEYKGRPSQYGGGDYTYVLKNYEQSATLDIKGRDNQYIGYCGPGMSENIDLSNPNASGEDYNFFQTKLVVRNVADVNNERIYTYHVRKGDGKTNNKLSVMCDHFSTPQWQQSIRTRHISKITFPGGVVEFTYAYLRGHIDEEEALTGIIVKNLSGTVVKNIRLEPDPQSQYNRPCLQSIQILSDKGIVRGRYDFTYWGKVHLPYDTPNVNAWGYYIYQIDGKQAYIPKLHAEFGLSEYGNQNMLKFCFGNNDYYMDEGAASKAYMLKTISYPTGGVTEFTYEASTFFEESRQKRVATGSLRIKEINYYGDGANIRRIFKYGKNESGTGIPVRILTDQDFMTSYNQNIYSNGVMPAGWSLYGLYKVDLHARPVINDFLGSASIVYDQVTEYSDEQGINGKTVYEYDYSNLSQIRSQRIAGSGGSPWRPVLVDKLWQKHEEWRVGQLLCKSIYDSADLLVRKEQNTYRESQTDRVLYMTIFPQYVHVFSNPKAVGWKIVSTLKAGEEPDNNILFKGVGESFQYDGQASFTSGYKSLVSTSVSEYRNGETLTSVTDYSYNAYLMPTLIRRRANNQKTFDEQMTYPIDLQDATSQKMQEMYFISPVIRKVTMIGSGGYDIYTPYRFENGIPVPDRIETGKGNNTREIRIQFKKYNEQGQLLEAVKDNAKVISYIWGYKTQYPIAEVEGVDYMSISELAGYLQNSMDSVYISQQCETLRGNLKGRALVTSYTYLPLIGISSVTLPNGCRKSYTYNGFGELVGEINNEQRFEKKYQYHYR